MALFEPKRIRLTDYVTDVFKGETIPVDSEGEILLQEWDKQGRQIWFVEFYISTSVGDKIAQYAEVYPDQAERLEDEG